MNWDLAAPGTRVANKAPTEVSPGMVYMFTLVPSGRPKRGNLVVIPRSSGARPTLLGNEVTLAQAKRLAEQHWDEMERQGQQGGETRLAMVRALMAEAKDRWAQWTSRHSSSPHRAPREWRAYMTTTAHPLNKAACDLLIDLHSQLPREEWPRPLVLYVGYVEDYDQLIMDWGPNFEGQAPDTVGRAFPRSIDRYVAEMEDPDLHRNQPVKLKPISRTELLFGKL